MVQHLILGTAGHIDHGKSSLVKCLTGSDPDRLPEEKARGVTIELGFAHLSIADKEQQYEIGIIDVPGHADFVNNMVSGVGALDIALFIVAADDGWMPQSEEHLHILSYLGIKNIIIALTKADLCDDVAFSVEMLRSDLEDTAIAECPIIPVSSVTGEGVENLKRALLDKIKNHPPHDDTSKPRLAIDRIFSPRGTGTVVTGTLTGGSIQSGQCLTLQPQGITTKVRYIQSHNTSLQSAFPGMRTALNLPDLAIQSPGKTGAKRGDVLTTEDAGTPCDTIDVLLERHRRAIPGIRPRALKHMEIVVVHHGSARSRARVILQGKNQLSPGESRLAQLRFEQPVFLFTGDRLIIREGSQQSTLAGALVLDAQATRHGFRTEQRAAFLEARAGQPNDPATMIRTLLARDHAASADKPLTNNPFSQTLISKTIEQLISEGSVIRENNTLLQAKWWKTLTSHAGSAIDAWHRKHPDLPAMPLEELTKSIACPASLFPLLTNSLSSKDYRTSGKGIAHARHTLSLPDAIRDDAQSILDTLNSSGLNPANKNDLCHTAQRQQAMKYLIRSGQAIELEPKVVISVSTRDSAIESVRSFITSHGKATASEIRQHLDTTRKVLMPLLEHLDDIGITKREQNHRTLANHIDQSP